MRHLRRAHHRPTPREVQLVFVLPGLFGGPLETRTPDPLIKSSRKGHEQTKENQKLPTIASVSHVSLCGVLVLLGPVTRTFSGQFSGQTDSRLAAHRGVSL